MIVAALFVMAAQAAFDSGRLLPIAPGDWTYSSDPAGSTARFDGQFLIRCDRASRRVTLNRLAPAGAAPGRMEIATDSRTLDYPGPVASLSADDTALDAIAFTRGRFIVTVQGLGKIALPFQPEAARSIEDCRN